MKLWFKSTLRLTSIWNGTLSRVLDWSPGKRFVNITLSIMSISSVTFWFNWVTQQVHYLLIHVKHPIMFLYDSVIMCSSFLLRIYLTKMTNCWRTWQDIVLYWLLLRLSLFSQINAFDRGKVVYQIPSRRLFINVFSLRRPL